MDLGQAMRNVFPHTLDVLQRQGNIILTEHFSVELTRWGSVLGDQSWAHWFPAFLKLQAVPSQILELAEFEYLRDLVERQDFGRARLDPGQVGLVAGAQFVFLSVAQPLLGKAPGLYCLFRSAVAPVAFHSVDQTWAKENPKNSAVELLLRPQDAVLIDLLHEPRKFNRQQLVDQAELEGVAPRESLIEARDHLLSSGLLVEGGSVVVAEAQFLE